MIKQLYHIYLFTFGCIYYLVLPFIIVLTNSFIDFPGMQNLYKYYDNKMNSIYIITVILCYISFIIGSLFPLNFLTKQSNDIVTEHVIGNRDLFLISIIFFLFGQFSILQNINNLFQGYLVEYNAEFMGSIATVNTFFLFFLIYQKQKNKIKRNKYLEFYLVFALFEFSVILLGLGSRMYILIPLISYVLYLLNYKKISLHKIFYRGCIIIVFFLCVGLWRLGDNISLEGLLYIGIAEPAFTWISAESMYTSNELPYFMFPSNYLTSFLNFIPTLLFPNKSSFMEPIPLFYDNPLGATNLLVSLISNFGIIGSFVCLFLFGVILTTIRINSKSIFLKTYYFCVCGIIPFQLFRDSITIVNKMILYNIFIFPLLLLLIEKFLYKKTYENNN